MYCMSLHWVLYVCWLSHLYVMYDTAVGILWSSASSAYSTAAPDRGRPGQAHGRSKKRWASTSDTRARRWFLGGHRFQFRRAIGRFLQSQSNSAPVWLGVCASTWQTSDFSLPQEQFASFRATPHPPPLPSPPPSHADAAMEKEGGEGLINLYSIRLPVTTRIAW